MNRVAPSEMGKRLLLTGAEGFTGQYLTRAAEQHGHIVKPLMADLTDAQSVSRELTGQTFDYVVHLAAISAVTHSNELELYQVNLLGTVNLLDALSRLVSPPDKIIVASSANVYGNSPHSPITEQAPLAPRNHYAMSKLAMEHALEQYHDRLPLITVRPFNYTGAGHDDRFLIPKLVHHFATRQSHVALGNIEIEREFNDIRTVCKAYLGLLESGINRETYNICSGKAHSLEHVIGILSGLSGHPLPIKVNPELVRSNEVRRLCGHPGKIEACLGTLSLQSYNLEDTLQWMLDSARQPGKDSSL